MYKINFICHGNICRSTMAESIMSYLVKNKNIDNLFQISSSATSREEIGESPHIGTIKKLQENNIKTVEHKALQITQEIAEQYDFLICMDNNNIRNLKRLIKKEDFHKISLLLSWADLNKGITDPWYSGDFQETFEDVYLGCEMLLKKLLQNK